MGTLVLMLPLMVNVVFCDWSFIAAATPLEPATVREEPGVADRSLSAIVGVEVDADAPCCETAVVYPACGNADWDTTVDISMLAKIGC